MKKSNIVLFAGFATLLTACGSSGPSRGPVIALTNQTSTATSPLSVVTVGTMGTASTEGSLNRSSDTLTLDGAALKLNAAGTGAVGEGDTATIASGDTDYVASYISGNTLGVYGTPTYAFDRPVTGKSNYDGESVVVLIDADGVYDLKGDASIDVDFKQNIASAQIANLDGTLSTGTSAPSDVTNGGTITLSDIAINKTQMTGGDVSFQGGSILTTASGSEVTDVAGQLYGPDADEVGGVFELDDRSAGNLLIVGTFTGN